MSTSPNKHGPSRDELGRVLDLVTREAVAYLDELDGRPARKPGREGALARLKGPLPESGSGAADALQQLIECGLDSAVTSSGPRCFHFVIGGTTPAALGADWLASTLDQMAYAWVASPLAVELEMVSLSWLKELFGLPESWGGILTTGASIPDFPDGVLRGRTICACFPCDLRVSGHFDRSAPWVTGENKHFLCSSMANSSSSSTERRSRVTRDCSRFVSSMKRSVWSQYAPRRGKNGAAVQCR